MSSDIHLVKRASKGERAAFAQIVELNKKKIFYLAYDLTGSREDAEDLSQEVFIKAYRSVKNFKGEASLSSWLYRITVNAFIDRKRKMSSKIEKESPPLEEVRETEAAFPFDGGETPGDMDADASPEGYARAMQFQEHIETALETLTPRERAVFVMRHYQDMSGKKVATLLKISEGTVKSLLFRAIKKLQLQLKDYGNTYGNTYGSRKKEVRQ